MRRSAPAPLLRRDKKALDRLAHTKAPGLGHSLGVRAWRAPVQNYGTALSARLARIEMTKSPIRSC